MSFLLLVVGYQQDFILVEQEIQENFENLELRFFPVTTLENQATENAGLQLQTVQSGVDGILYLRKEQYLAFSRYITHSAPVRYVDISIAELLQVLLRVRLKHQHRLRKISMDIFTASGMRPVLGDLDIFYPEPQIQAISSDAYFQQGICHVFAEHERNLENGADVALTNIPQIHDMLLERGYSVFLIQPNAENVIREIRSLVLRAQLQTNQNRTVLIYLCLRYKDTTIVLLQVQFRELEEIANVSKTISLFAHKLDGAAFELSRWEYLLLCNENVFRTETQNFSHISLLEDISSSSVFNAVIAIGIGSTIKRAYAGAMSSYGMSVQIRNTNAVITIENQRTLEPILCKSQNYDIKNNLDDLLSDIAEKCHISYHSLQKLYLSAQHKRSNLFSSSEVAGILGCSARSANRLLERLLDNNRATISGYTLVGKQGRPSRMIRIHF